MCHTKNRGRAEASNEKSYNNCNTREGLSVYYTNSRSLGNKINELRAIAASEKPDILCISESWINLQYKHFKAEYVIEGYRLFNTDRAGNRKGGGVVIYVKDRIRCGIKTEIKTCNESETVWVEIKNDRKSLVLGLIYRTPGLDRFNSKIIYDEITKAARANTVCIVGDFNFRNINWENLTGDLESEDFLDMVQDNFLYQHGRESTRGNNILDLVFSNRENTVAGLEVGEKLANSDHNVIRFYIALDNTEKENKSVVPDFRLGNFQGLKARLATEAWEGINKSYGSDHISGETGNNSGMGLAQNEVSGGDFEVSSGNSTPDSSVQSGETSLNMDGEYENFVTTLKNIQKEFIPSKRFRTNYSDPRWMNNRVKHLIGVKKGIYRRIKRGEEHLRQRYIELTREVRKKVREAKRSYEERIARQAKDNPKQFYQHYQSKVKEKVGPLETASGHVTDDDKEMCTCLNEYFLSVFTSENLEYIPEVESIYSGNPESVLKQIDISREDVIKELNKLKAHKSPGPDEIYARVLKECKNELSCPLTTLFNNSIKSGLVPKAWKLADVVPIFKKGEKIKKSNYRPVSLTSTVGKILESIVANKIREHLEKHKLIKLSQHGFLVGCSCLTNLLSYYSEVFEAVDSGKAYDTVYLDFSKAFDRVPHERLIRKVEAHGIGGDVLRWIKEWLKDRKQRVCINGVKSEWGSVTSGVPQGSVLGPLLFIIYLNDLDIDISSNLAKFADDTKIGRAINGAEDCQALQNDLNRLYDWSEKWQMEFNVDKCKVVSMGTAIGNSSYKLNNLEIIKSQCERDLGVLISSNLKPREQCIAVRNKANKILGFISRSVSYRTDKVILKLYLALVRPHLDYAVQFWSPYYRMDIECLERVQRRMTKMIHNIRHLSYEDRLKSLNLHSLERCRVRGDMIEVCKWFKGFNKGDITKVLKINSGDRTRSNRFKLDKFRFRRELGRNWFGNRVVDEWNRLPDQIINARSLNSFKNKIDQYMSERGWT